MNIENANRLLEVLRAIEPTLKREDFEYHHVMVPASRGCGAHGCAIGWAMMNNVGPFEGSDIRLASDARGIAFVDGTRLESWHILRAYREWLDMDLNAFERVFTVLHHYGHCRSSEITLGMVIEEFERAIRRAKK